MAFFTDKVLAAIEVGAGVLVLGIVLRDGGIAVVTPGTGVVGLAGHGDQAFLPGFVLDVADNAPSDKVVGCFAQVGLFRLIEAFFELGQDDELGALFEGVVDDLSAYLMSVVVGQAGDFVVVFFVWSMLLRNATRFGLSIRRQASGADPEGVVPYSVRHIIPNTAAFGIPYQLLPTVGQCFSALDEIWGGGATVSLDGGTNGKAVGAGQGDGDKAFVLFYALFGGSAVFHDLFNGDVEHDFFLFDDNGRAHALGVFWKGSAGITVLDPGPGFSGVELEQDLAVGEILIHSLVIQH